MGLITVVIKDKESKIHSVQVNSNTLSELVNDKRLYENDMDFILEFLSTANREYGIYPSSDGIILIDMTKNIIYDSQSYTGIFKVTPTEIKSSYKGNTIGETADSSTIKRFKEALESNRLQGFEEWRDSGTQMNTSILDIDKIDVMTIIDAPMSYGQFIFETTPYRVETFEKTDLEDQAKLFSILVAMGCLEANDITWIENLGKL